ncbi:hypothetical protein QE152_g40765 [Popillia japonica]|uniref:Uncharacterized protein n=1 Tax=Popillia japonica TaxID=7064 RepID=A0AAW1HFA3_POPJA
MLVSCRREIGRREIAAHNASATSTCMLKNGLDWYPRIQQRPNDPILDRELSKSVLARSLFSSKNQCLYLAGGRLQQDNASATSTGMLNNRFQTISKAATSSNMLNNRFQTISKAATSSNIWPIGNIWRLEIEVERKASPMSNVWFNFILRNQADDKFYHGCFTSKIYFDYRAESISQRHPPTLRICHR